MSNPFEIPVGDEQEPNPAWAVDITIDTSRVEALRGELAPLYWQYAQQNNPQPAFIAMDEEGTVWADFSAEIGNAVPMYVWHGRTLRFGLSPHASGDELADFVTEHLLLFQAVHDGHTVEWNGHNHVGHFDAAAQEASDELSDLAGDLTPACAVVDDVEAWLCPDENCRAELQAEVARDGMETVTRRYTGRQDDCLLLETHVRAALEAITREEPTNE